MNESIKTVLHQPKPKQINQTGVHTHQTVRMNQSNELAENRSTAVKLQNKLV